MKMLFPEKMAEVSIIVHKNDLEDLLSTLHESGLIQITDYSESAFMSDEYFERQPQPAKRTEVLSELILESSKLLEILKKAEKEPESMYKALANYKPPELVDIDPLSIAEVISRSRRSLKKLEYISQRDTERASLTADINNIKLQIEKLQLFRKLNFDLSLFEPTGKISISVGRTTFPVELKKDLESSLSPEIQKSGQYGLYFHPLPPEQEGQIAVIIIPVSELGRIRKVVVGRHFKELDLAGLSGTPEQLISSLNKDMATLKSKLIKISDKLQEAHNRHYNELAVIHEELELCRNRSQIQARFGRTASTVVICGFCQNRRVKELERLCEETTGGTASLHFKEAEQKSDAKVPIKLNNPEWAKPFEMLTTTFAYPKYNEIDPTIIIAPLFVLFFGIMLGDAGYGMILLIASVFGYTKFGRGSRTIKNLSYLGMFVGFSTTVAGIIMGTFFGDLVQRFIYKDPDALLYSVEILGFQLPYDAFRSPMLLFMLSLMIGLFILNLGFILGAVQNLRAGKAKDIITGQLSWFILQPPAILLIGHSMFEFWVLSPSVFYVSSIALAAGLVLLIARYKGLTLFEITGFLGDWLSFVRLLALSLATVGMALTFNIMAELILNMGYNSITLVVFSIISIILLMVFHIFNLAIQALGASIHSLRLQYIELFNRCYEGGGVAFTPFFTNRVYSRLKHKNR